MKPANQPIRYTRYSLSAGWSVQDAHVITEANVDLSVNGEHWLTFACTPSDLEALAVGFLFNEGILRQRSEIEVVDVGHQGKLVDVWLNRAVEKPAEWRRTSGCTGGVTAVSENPLPAVSETQAAGGTQGDGETLAEGGSRRLPVTGAGERFSPEMILAGMEQLLNAQSLYRETGGVHSSALSDGQTLHLQADDIGRHNTIDKLAGRALLEGVSIRPAILLTTGRVSAEMLQKSARLGATVVVSRTSATSESVRLAEQAGITLVGYARKIQFLVYTHPERLRVG